METREDEVLLGSSDDTMVRPAAVPDELKEMQERLHVGDFGDALLDDGELDALATEPTADALTADAPAAAEDDNASAWLEQETSGLDELSLDADVSLDTPQELDDVTLSDGSDDFALDDLTLEVECSDETAAALTRQFDVGIGLRIEAQAVAVGSLPRSDGKSKRWIDLRTKPASSR